MTEYKIVSAEDIRKKPLFAIFTVDEITDVLRTINRLKNQHPDNNNEELLMYELLAVTKLKG